MNILYIIQVMDTFAAGFGVAVTVCFLVIWFFVHYFENIEKIVSQLLSLVKNISIFADKQCTKRDLQGRMNSFVKRLDKKMSGFVSVKMKIEFSTSEELEGFKLGDRYLIRVKRDINPNTNFVNVAMFFLSKHLLLKAKKQISQKQQQSIDLFVAKKLFEEEKISVMSEFVDSFLHPGTDDDKVRELFNKYTNSDRSGLFFPVFLQEMVFLGERVFSNPKNHRIQEEVNKLVDFLDKYSQRKIKEEGIENHFNGQFSKFAIMIVGKFEKVGKNDLTSYTNYIKGLIKEGTESIYLIGDIRNKDFIKEVGGWIVNNNDEYSVFNEESYSAEIKYKDDNHKEVRNFLLVLRKKNPDPFIQN